MGLVNDDYTSQIYAVYNETIKPLMAAVEANEQKFTIAFLNEIRDILDHISCCYLGGAEVDIIKGHIVSANGHVYRVISDCYKLLIIHCDDEITAFERKTRFVDLDAIENGAFSASYYEKRREARECLKSAKRAEHLNHISDEEKAGKFAEAFNSYEDIERCIEGKRREVTWARRKYRLTTGLGTAGKGALWLVSIIASTLLGFFLEKWVSGSLKIAIEAVVKLFS